MEKISIIIPVYNSEKYLDRCITSVINQTYKNIEVIIINDGSTDNSQEICEKYIKKDDRIVLINQKNSGVSFARNTGLKKATGEYIAFVDSDDYVDKRYIEKLCSNIIKHNCDICICSTCKVYPNGVIENEKREQGLYTQEEYISRLLKLQGFGVCRNSLYKCDVINGVRFDHTLKVGEDFYFNLNISKNIRKVMVISESLYYYCVNNSSLVRKFNHEYGNDYYNSSNKVKQYVEKNYNDDNILKNMVNNYTIFNLLLVIVNYICHRDNTSNIFNMRKNIKALLKDDLYKNALKKCDINCYDKKKRITIMALRFHLYLIVALIGKIRQYQLNAG